MENEFYDEARKCPQCNIVTYCDRCPICGKLLPRSSASAKFAKFTGHVAGEEDELLQTRVEGSLREHIEVDTSSQSKNLFEYAEHSEPKVKLHGAHINPTHPYFQEGEPKRVSANVSVIARIIGIVLIVGVLTIIVGAVTFKDGNVMDRITTDDDIFLKEPIFGGIDEIQGSNYRYYTSDDESVIEIENVGDRSFFGTLEFYNQEKLIGSVDEILIMPDEICDLSTYTSNEATSYRFVDYEFYEISSTKPNIDFEINNDYGSISLYTDENIDREDLEILIPYFLEASSYDAYFEMLGLEVYVDQVNIYSVYMNEDNTKAEVFELDEYEDAVDHFSISLSENKNLDIGAAL